MTSLVTIRMNDKLLRTMKANAHHLQLSQTDYIRKAIEQMNNQIEQQKRQKRLTQASLRVRKNSMAVNAEFSGIEHEPSA